MDLNVTIKRKNTFTTQKRDLALISEKTVKDSSLEANYLT
jgi:hypothetical protein